MKVITEERLRELFTGDCGFDLEAMLKHECKEIDQLTVTKLRPMSELYKYEPLDVFMFCKRGQKLVHAKYDPMIDEYMVLEDGLSPVAFDYYDGWIPVPVYKPEP